MIVSDAEINVHGWCDVAQVLAGRANLARDAWLGDDSRIGYPDFATPFPALGVASGRKHVVT